MAYRKHKHDSYLVFNPNYPDIDSSNFKECDLMGFYEGSVEAIPPNAPPPRGKEVPMHVHRQLSCWQ